MLENEIPNGILNKFVFFGTDDFAVKILESLKNQNQKPSLIVTTPNTPQGRGLVLTPPPVKNWSLENKIESIQPENLKDAEVYKKIKESAEIFIVASYGKILPKTLLDYLAKPIINIHPSLLPDLRGPSPIQTAILAKDETGVSIMLLDEQVDHGPILTQRKAFFPIWPIPRPEVADKLAQIGSELLIESIPLWIEGKINPIKQDHSKATFSKKISKKDGEIDLEDPAILNYRKYCAFFGWPGTYFFLQKNDQKVRVQIKKASLENGNFEIKRVLPEGKKEMDYQSFQNGFFN